MPRPKKMGFDYLSLDTDFFTNSKKSKALRRAHGQIGLLTYLWILCRIYASGYYYKFVNMEELCLDIAEDITGQSIKRTAAQVNETINYLVENGVLDKQLLEQNVISGTKIQEQYVLMAYKTKRNTVMGVYCLIDVNSVIQKNKVFSEKNTDNSEKNAVNSEDGTQSNSYSNTTTIPLSVNARTREDVTPSITDVARCFRDDMGLSMTQSMKEAEYFMEYNRGRGWDCLPNWRGAVLRWCKNMKED